MPLTVDDMKRFSDLGASLEIVTFVTEILERDVTNRHTVTKPSQTVTHPSRGGMSGAERTRKYREKRRLIVTPTVTNVTSQPVTEASLVPHTPLEKTPFLSVSQEVLKKESKGIARENEQGFAELWAIFPKREGNNPRKPALQSYLRAIKNGVTVTEICDGALRYACHCDVGTRFVQQCVTWLNQEGWKNEYALNTNRNGSAFAQASRLIDESLDERDFDSGHDGDGGTENKPPPC